jgi:glycosyltransferase involved in cell wall biosynthesis
MRILIVSTSDIGHGAGIAAYRLLTALQQLGHQASMLVAEKRSDDPHVVIVRPVPKNPLARCLFSVEQFLERGLNVTGLQNLYSVRARTLLRHELVAQADIIHLHNLHWHANNFSILAIPVLAGRKPVVWTIHDMWPLTGHCLYAYDCQRWRTGCGACPDLSSYMGVLFDLTSFMVGLKRRLVRCNRLSAISPSKWLHGLMAASPVFTGVDLRCIPNGVDTEVFKPSLREAARRYLGIPEGAKVILFASSHFNDTRKGGTFFVEAVKRLHLDQEPLILSVGQGGVAAADLGGLPVRNLGYVADAQEMADLYAASDVYVMPSLQDNLPNVVLESLACGTPVVCFDTGGLSDMVEHRRNGWLARPRDPDDLAEGIRYVLGCVEKLDLREAAVRTVHETFTLRHAAESHLAIYRERIASFHGGKYR